ncbi:hypothetical protein B9Z55_008994 [Caenorhabditis nigoni]|uniref:Uncharacterized protein n=1 Tax=Caenorhabditis nigoni TaxID=1611254 RepID=A0A2G5UQ41_9PELO|nr:hypothetical protein B9Z55_008994 [Caenorhabditis nigoni]
MCLVCFQVSEYSGSPQNAHSEGLRRSSRKKMRLIQKSPPGIYKSSCREANNAHIKDAPIGRQIRIHLARK